MKYLLDTNAISEPLRPKPAPGLMRRLRDHDGEMAVPAPVWHELRFGCARLPPSRRRDVLERYIEDVVLVGFPVIDYDRAAADWHAVERARLAATGRTPPYADGQIAAIARVNDLILVTSNLRDFERFDGLRAQNWM